MKQQIEFDFTDAQTKDDSDKIMSVLVDSSLNELTSGQGDSDDISTTGFRGLDTRAFNYAFDGTNWDRLRSTGGALHVDIQDANISVIENDVYAEDSAHTTADEGGFVLTVRQDTLAASTDADGDYAAFKTNNVGELYVTDEGSEALLSTISGNIVDVEALLTTIDADTSSISLSVDGIEALLTTIDADTSTINTNIGDLTKAEDSVHVSGDKGIMPLAVRNDGNTALAADGDYIPFSTNSTGDLHVTLNNESLNVQDNDLANTAILASQKDVDNTVGGTKLLASNLTDRKYAYIANHKNKTVYLGPTGVTTSTGFPLPPKSMLDFRLGAAVDVYAISPDATPLQDIRILELS